MSEEANEIYIERDRERWREMERDGESETERDGERWREMERDEAIAVSQELMVE